MTFLGTGIRQATLFSLKFGLWMKTGRGLVSNFAVWWQKEHLVSVKNQHRKFQKLP